MKLLTVNVHAWMEENPSEKLDVLARTIAERAYDVIALQEVNQQRKAPLVGKELKQDNYGLVLLERLRNLGIQDYSYFWTNSHIGYDTYDEGLAILTKLPVYGIDEFYCSTHKTIDSILSRKVLGVTVYYEDQLIELYSCHINLPGSQGEDQLENIQAILDRTSTSHLKVLMGDFNTDALSDVATYEAIKDLGLRDSYDLAEEKDAGITVSKAIDGWSQHTQEKRLDYVFLTKERRVLTHRVVFNGSNQSVISDHFGVEVELSLT